MKRDERHLGGPEKSANNGNFCYKKLRESERGERERGRGKGNRGRGGRKGEKEAGEEGEGRAGKTNIWQN